MTCVRLAREIGAQAQAERARALAAVEEHAIEIEPKLLVRAGERRHQEALHAAILERDLGILARIGQRVELEILVELGQNEERRAREGRRGRGRGSRRHLAA